MSTTKPQEPKMGNVSTNDNHVSKFQAFPAPTSKYVLHEAKPAPALQENPREILGDISKALLGGIEDGSTDLREAKRVLHQKEAGARRTRCNTQTNASCNETLMANVLLVFLSHPSAAKSGLSFFQATPLLWFYKETARETKPKNVCCF